VEIAGRLVPAGAIATGGGRTSCAIAVKFNGPPSKDVPTTMAMNQTRIARFNPALAPMALGECFFDPPAARWRVLMNT
jgi:hypothetical protein